MADWNQNPPNQPLSYAGPPVSIPLVLSTIQGDRLGLETGLPDYSSAEQDNIGFTTNIVLPQISGYTEEYKTGILIYDLYLAYLTYQCPTVDYPEIGQVWPLGGHNEFEQ